MAAKNGDTVFVHYTGTLDDGTIFDSSQDRAPLEAALGKNMLIPGFENALLGMVPGEKKTVTLAPADAYGEYMEDLALSLPRAEMPQHLKPEPGMMIQLRMDDGEEFDAVITDVTDENVTADANHPLAGENLTFVLELVRIL